MKKVIVFSIGLVFAALFSGAFAEECQNKRSNRLFDQDFGIALTPNDLLSSMFSPWAVDYFRPWRRMAALSKDLGSTIKVEKDKFQVNLDVQHFSPDEITVKTSGGDVVIEAKHEEKQDDHGFVSRQFIRRYALPEGTDAEKIISELSSDGILTVTAPRKVVEGSGEKVVPITKTGPVRKEAKVTKEEESLEVDDKNCYQH